MLGVHDLRMELHAGAAGGVLEPGDRRAAGAAVTVKPAGGAVHAHRRAHPDVLSARQPVE